MLLLLVPHTWVRYRAAEDEKQKEQKLTSLSHPQSSTMLDRKAKAAEKGGGRCKQQTGKWHQEKTFTILRLHTEGSKHKSWRSKQRESMHWRGGLADAQGDLLVCMYLLRKLSSANEREAGNILCCFNSSLCIHFFGSFTWASSMIWI